MGIRKYKKQIIFGFSLTVFISALIAVILFFILGNKSIQTSSTNNINNIVNIDNQTQVIPNVTKENTSFKMSELKKEVESFNISATNRLKDFNLCYYLKYDDKTKMRNEDYLIFNDLLLILDENCTICFKYELDGKYSSESYEIKVSNIKVPKPETEKVSKEQLEKEKVNKTEIKKSTLPYFIKVNYGANVVTIYKQDKDGNYTVPYKAMVCSCGTYTPTNGTYKTTNKYTWRILINNVYGQYATRIVGSILFHSVPYTSNKKDTLEYWEYDKLGQTASAGCVRLTVRDAKWIYDNCPRGTMVEFYSSSNPGPLGKPSSQKISSNEECRNWDPTDPGANNPWHTYNSNKEEIKDANTTTNDNNSTNSTPIINNNTIIDKPSVEVPNVDKPDNNDTSTDNTTVDKPNSNETSTGNPTVDETNNNDTSTDNPTVNKPNNNEPSTDNSTVDKPNINEPSTI